MTRKELWSFAREKSVRTYRLYFGLGRELVWITQADFEKIKPYFTREKINIFSKNSYRSKSVWRHVHAVDYGKFVNIHCDTGNPVIFFPLSIFHFVFDVLPYLPHLIRYKGIYFMDLSDVLSPE